MDARAGLTLDPGGKLDRQQRVAADVEEIVAFASILDTDQLAPDAGDVDLARAHQRRLFRRRRRGR